MKYTDKQILDAYLPTLNYTVAADNLGAERSVITRRILQMQDAGVNIPGAVRKKRPPTKFTEKYVAELNVYVRSKLS